MFIEVFNEVFFGTGRKREVSKKEEKMKKRVLQS
jgi:hypothetical protein